VVKQVIIIRRDLKCRRGKEIVQGSHASMAFLLSGFGRLSSEKLKILMSNLGDWKNSGQTKVCLQINSEEELLELYQKAIDNGLESHYITDAGRTEFNGVPTITALAIGPNDSDKIDKITGNLKLY